MLDKTFDTIVDIISEFTDFVIYKLSRTKKKKKKNHDESICQIFIQYLTTIHNRYIYISQYQFDTYLYFVCINNNLLDIANFEICNIHLLFTKCVHTYVYTCKMNFSALHNHSLSNKQCVVDVFFDNVRVLQRYCKEITFFVHNTVSLQVDSAIVRPLSVGIEAYLFLLFCVFIVSNMLIKVSRNCRLIPQ